jgi:hypothetical protein
VIPGWNHQVPHQLERGDKVIFDTPNGMIIGTYTDGDPGEVTNYINIRKFEH